MNLILLVEELAKFVKRESRGKGWWYRLLLKINMTLTEMECAIPDIGKLFSLPNVVVRVIFKAVRSCETHRNVTSHHFVPNRVKEFKAKNGFDNEHLETSVVLMMKQR